MTTDHDPQKAMADALELALDEIVWTRRSRNIFPVRLYCAMCDAEVTGDTAHDPKCHIPKIEAALVAYRAQAEEPKYRMLEAKELIQEDDEWSPSRGAEENSRVWYVVDSTQIGTPLFVCNVGYFRRPITQEDAR